MLLFEGKLVEGKFVKRVNRFIAQVEINGEDHHVHVPNTGRMKELLVIGAKVILKYHPAPHKKTEYRLISVEKGGNLVCIDSHITNKLYFEYLLDDNDQDFLNIKDARREVGYKNSRFDIGAIQNNNPCLIEVKSVNLVKDDIAMFPDAPTTRGNKHIQELIEAKQQGITAGIIFIVQRSDAEIFRPHWEMDLDFSKSLVMAYSKGVIIKAYKCVVDRNNIQIKKQIPIELDNMTM